MKNKAYWWAFIMMFISMICAILIEENTLAIYGVGTGLLYYFNNK